MASVIPMQFPLITCLKPRKQKWSDRSTSGAPLSSHGSKPRGTKAMAWTEEQKCSAVCQVKSNYSLLLPLEKERKSCCVKAGFKQGNWSYGRGC